MSQSWAHLHFVDALRDEEGVVESRVEASSGPLSSQGLDQHDGRLSYDGHDGQHEDEDHLADLRNGKHRAVNTVQGGRVGVGWGTLVYWVVDTGILGGGHWYTGWWTLVYWVVDTGILGGGHW